MKQSINSKQLKELTFEQISRLGKMSGLVSYPRTEEAWQEDKQKEYLTMYTSLMDYCNIGKMLEILWENKVPLTYYLVFNGTDNKDASFEDLCDELWNEVKRVI